VRLVKGAAIALATIGLIVLWFAATRAPIPSVEIGRAGATTNMAYVQVDGYVVRSPTYYEDSGYLSFVVADETGEVRVSAYRQEAEALRSAGRVPALGDHVTVAGTLRIREEDVAMTLNVPDHLEIVRPEATDREIGTLSAQDELARVRVRGQVWAVEQPYEGLTLVTLRDTSGAIDVAVDQNLELLTGALLPLEPGQSVETLAAVSLYRDTPQLVPASVADLVLLAEEVPVAHESAIGALRIADADRMMTVEGTVVEVDPFSAGVKATLEDDSGQIVMLLWQDLYDSLPYPQALAPGSRVRVTGAISVYRNELEVIPERTIDVVVLQAADVPDVPDETTTSPVPMGELSIEQSGQTVLVEGTVVDVASFPSGFKFTLDDGSGQAILFTWLSTYDEIPDVLSLHTGAQVRVTGEVDIYDEELNVIPESGGDVTILSPGAPDAPLREIGALSTSHVETVVTVAGEVTRAEPFSTGHRVWIDDGTGEVMILLWDNVYQRVPGDLTPGTQIRATGRVEEYQGTLEVVPRVPGDVIVGGM
jgi:DNA/RNA endonuclease YhcR with UshA esterase domain